MRINFHFKEIILVVLLMICMSNTETISDQGLVYEDISQSEINDLLTTSFFKRILQ